MGKNVVMATFEKAFLWTLCQLDLTNPFVWGPHSEIPGWLHVGALQLVLEVAKNCVGWCRGSSIILSIILVVTSCTPCVQTSTAHPKTKQSCQNPPPVLLVSSPCPLVRHRHLHQPHPFHPSLLIKMKANPLNKLSKRVSLRNGPQRKIQKRTTKRNPDTWEKTPWDLTPGWVAESQPHQFEEKNEVAESPAQLWTQAFCLRPHQRWRSWPRQSTARFLASWHHARKLSW